MLANPTVGGIPLSPVADKLDRLIKMAFGPVFGRVLRATFDPRAATAAVPWWLTGGIASANCLAAYQAKGAADYASSKVNLANPGTYDAADGAAYPTWDATNGWIFNGSSQFLTTGIVLSNTYTLYLRFSNASSNTDQFCGSIDFGTPNKFIFVGRYDATRMWFGAGTGDAAINCGTVTSGRMGVAGTDFYFNGSDVGNGPGGDWPSTEVYFGKNNSDGAIYWAAVYIQAASFYNVTLTPTQMGLLDTAMAAL